MSLITSLSEAAPLAQKKVRWMRSLIFETFLGGQLDEPIEVLAPRNHRRAEPRQMLGDELHIEQPVGSIDDYER